MTEKPKYRMGTGEKVFLWGCGIVAGFGLIVAVIGTTMALKNERKKAQAKTAEPQAPATLAPPAAPAPVQVAPQPEANPTDPSRGGHGSESLEELGLPANLVPTVSAESLQEILPQPPLVYPSVARTAKIQGVVVVEVTISASGYPISAVAQDGPVALREVAEQWQMKRKFQPPVVKGQNKAVKVMNSVNFTIAETPGAQTPTSKTAVASSVQPVAQPNQTLGDQRPKVITQAPATFPRRARQMRWEINLDHTVDLKVFVSEQGQPLKVSVLGGIGFGFDEAAIEAANKSTYAPAMRNGQPTRGWVDMKVVVPKL